MVLLQLISSTIYRVTDSRTHYSNRTILYVAAIVDRRYIMGSGFLIGDANPVSVFIKLLIVDDSL